MMILRVDHNHCEGDCIAKEGYLLIGTYWCGVKDFIKINNYEIYCPSIFRDYRDKMFEIMPGERIKITHSIFLDYPSENRIYLDYDMYQKIITLMRNLNMKRLLINKIEFRDPEFGCTITNTYQVICYDEIYIPRSSSQPFLTKNGVMELPILRSESIHKGECKSITKDDVSICYGDPE